MFIKICFIFTDAKIHNYWRIRKHFCVENYSTVSIPSALYHHNVEKCFIETLVEVNIYN